MPQAKPYSFPAFYACYLLKSARTPRSYRNYIGSTPDPVRRLRQHNGLVTGGARETAVNRPWVMHLLVHGFPSRPAATSFEFAWQNPHRSRFLRNDTAEPLFERKRGAKFQHNVLVLQQMIRTYPFSTWPLHVKLFTEEAVQCWNKLTSTSPICCFNHLETLLCPHTTCTSVSHLGCLAKLWLETERMLPRGGTCLSCEQYTLWGDIVKGCFRRHTGRIIEDEDVDPDQKMLEAAEEEVEGIKEQAELEGISYSGLSVDARSSRSRSMTRSPSTYLRSRSRVEDKAETLTRKLELLSLEDTTSRASPRGKASTTSKGKIARPKAGTCDGSKVTAKGNYKANAKRSNVTKGSSSLLTPASAVLEVNGSTVLLSRGHGRPKKVTGDSEADLNSPNSGGVTTTPKRTGRPRKHVVDPVISTSRGERPSKQSAVSAVIPIEPPSSISTVMSREVSSPPICSTDLALEQENQSEALLETKLKQPAISTPQEHGIPPERQNDDQSTTTVPNEEIIQRNSPYPKMARPKRRGRPRKSASVGDLSDG
ncbi:Structure-specific endonuclease subunit slx1 [Leucoagaricus sp. SymC.cos]|nr:Structure-specific endonuclease subunit slx1 [Leucoagaricus sp. SymC.cos]